MPIVWCVRPLLVSLLGILLACGASASADVSADVLQGASGGIVEVVHGLRSPVQVTFAPGVPGVLYVVEQSGVVRVVRAGKIRAQPFLDIRSKVYAEGEQGLLGLAFAPDYVKSRQFVVDYTDVNGDTRVVRYRSDGTKALTQTARQLLMIEQPDSHHNGGSVAYGKDRLLYVGTGDGGPTGAPDNPAQNPLSLLGKILRLDPAHPAAKPVIVAFGVRNPWRFSFDRVNGDLWIGDVGDSSIEEIDHVAWPWQGQLNFGWDAYEGRSPFKSTVLGPGRLVMPVAQYKHGSSCSVIGGYVYRGSAMRASTGRYFYGDYCSGAVWSLKLVGAAARDIRREPFTVAHLTSFGEDTEGEIYALSGNGVLYRLVR